MQKKTTLLFDMDGTLIDTEFPYCRAMQAACQDFGIDMTEERYFEDYAGATVADNWQRMEAYVGDIQLARKIIQQSDKVYQDIIQKEGVPLKPHAKETLASLEKRGYQLVIASSSTRPVVMDMLARTRLDVYFSLLVTGDMITHSKPHPEIFQKALELTASRASDTVVIEDSFQGVTAGYRAGIDTIMIPDYHQPTPEIAACAVAVLPTLSELLPLLP
ncbi:MAG: HAD family phosphatase [Aerococcus sp.]|nr:HAD family phosphatase [Aerococcus sp.]